MAQVPWKMPPLAKIYEAIGAVGDGRVRIEDARRALVTSSEGDKTYQVENSDGCREISSNDNASFWQGYLGYPAIAVMIARGVIAATDEAKRALAGVAWKQLNSRYRNDYERTIAEALRRAQERGFDAAALRAEAEAMLEAVRRLAPMRGRRLSPPRASTGVQRKPAASK